MPEFADLLEAFDRYEKGSGIMGVALGTKDPDDPASESAVTFLVPEKKPRRGAQRRLDDGTRALPKTLTVDGNRMLTDVVEAPATAEPPVRNRLQRKKFTAGGPVSNRASTGTFGCLVRVAGDARTFALTNRHVAIAPRRPLFFPKFGIGAVAALTTRTVDLVPDEDVFPFQDEPRTFVDVDVALAALPAAALHRFDPAIPTIGRPDRTFTPDLTSLEAMRQSVQGREVEAWSWNTGKRRGVVSHVAFVTRSVLGGPVRVYTYLIRSSDGMAPGEPRDSGKVWISSGAPGVEWLGVHKGVLRRAGDPTAYALAMDASLASGLLSLRPA